MNLYVCPKASTRRVLTKQLLVMKLTLVLLVGFLLNAQGNGFSQTITLSAKNIPLEKVFPVIKKQTGYLVFYNEDLLENAKRITINVKNEDLETVLGLIFRDQPLGYFIENKTIVITKKTFFPEAKVPEVTQADTTREVRGTVRNERGEPLPGASVVVTGTSTGSSADAAGNFMLRVPDNRSELTISFIGYSSQQVTIGVSNRVTVVLQEAASSVDDIVVMGYRSVRKSDLTGAVGVVDVENLTKQPSGSIASLLQGQASGVSVIGNGQPGEQPKIQIRGINTFGDNTPLYVVDGVPTQDISDINPGDVASMSILKDAGSASIYGARASNGVVLITTKKGSGKVKVQYEAYYGVQRPLGGNVWHTLNSQEAADLKWLALKNSGLPLSDPLYGNGASPVLPDYLFPIGAMEGDPSVDLSLYHVDPNYTNSDELNNFYRIVKVNKSGTDWFREIFKPAPITSHNLSVSQGNDRGNYYFSLNHFNQQGILLNTYLKRYTLRLNSSYNIGKGIKIGENLSVALAQNLQSPSLSEATPIGMAIRISPLVPVHDIKGNFGGTYGNAVGNAYNPVAMLERDKNNKNSFGSILGNVFGEVNFLKSFTFKTSFGGQLQYGIFRSFSYPTYENTENSTTNQYSENAYDMQEFTWTNTLTYHKRFNKHDIKVLLGSESIQTYTHGLSGSRMDYFTFDPDYTTLSTGTSTIDNGSYRDGYSLNSLFGNLNYDFHDKYLLNFTIRQDGSSKFSSQYRYGFFPAISAGWRISNEKFIKDKVSWLNDLKLRAGWGVMGNQSNVGSGNTYSTFRVDRITAFYPIEGFNTLTPGIQQANIGNPDARWEKDINLNIGVDAMVLNGALQFTLDYYEKDIKDLLFTPQLLGTQGTANAPVVNIAEMSNKGLDFSITSNFNRTGPLKVSATGTLTTYDNRIHKVSNSSNYFDSDSRRFSTSFVRNQTGQPVGSFYGYKIAGFWNTQAEVAEADAKAQQTTGDPNTIYQTDAVVGRFRYVDINGDGEITPDDRTVIGNPNPKFSYGFNLNLAYENFDFSIFLYGVQGNNIWNNVKWWTDFYASQSDGGKSKTALYDSWTPENHNAKAPIQETGGSFSTNLAPNDYYIENGSYLRAKNMQLGYTVPQNLIKRISVEKLRIYLSAANFFTITKYKGPDPEIGGGTTSFGIDEGSYITPKMFLIGLNLTF